MVMGSCSVVTELTGLVSELAVNSKFINNGDDYQMFTDWDHYIREWRTLDIDWQEVAFAEELTRDHPHYNLSYSLQYYLDSIFFEIVNKSKVKSGDYHYMDECIYPYYSYNQSRQYYSRQFASELAFGTTEDKFYLQTNMPDINCIWQQYDTWWLTLFQLAKNYDFHFYRGVDYEESKSRNISEMVRMAGELVVSEQSDQSFGHVLITWGNVYESESSLDDGVNVFKALHKLNHGLYRTKYIRKKSK